MDRPSRTTGRLPVAIRCRTARAVRPKYFAASSTVSSGSGLSASIRAITRPAIASASKSNPLLPVLITDSSHLFQLMSLHQMKLHCIAPGLRPHFGSAQCYSPAASIRLSNRRGWDRRDNVPQATGKDFQLSRSSLRAVHPKRNCALICARAETLGAPSSAGPRYSRSPSDGLMGRSSDCPSQPFARTTRRRVPTVLFSRSRSRFRNPENNRIIGLRSVAPAPIPPVMPRATAR
jgi:hypothetical protein